MEIFRILQGPERLEIDRRRYLKYLEEMCSVENLWFGLQESRGLVVASESRPTDQLRTVLRNMLRSPQTTLVSVKLVDCF